MSEELYQIIEVATNSPEVMPRGLMFEGFPFSIEVLEETLCIKQGTLDKNNPCFPGFKFIPYKEVNNHD